MWEISSLKKFGLLLVDDVADANYLYLMQPVALWADTQFDATI